MNRLWVRLVVAFGLVAAVAVAAIALLLSWQADTHFRQYVTQSGFTRQGGLAEGLEAHYRENQSWDGVETLLDAAFPAQGPKGWGRNPPAAGRFSLKLADADGWVIYGERAGQLTEAQMAGAVSLVVDGVAVVIKTAEMLVDLKNMGIMRTKKGLDVSPVSKEELLAARKIYGFE